MKLEILKNGRPRGWVVSSMTITFVAGCFVAGLCSDAVMERIVKMEDMVYALFIFGSGGMTFKGLIGAWGQRKGGA